MPSLDMSDVILDPDFMDLVTVRRMAETVNGFGEAVMTPTTFPNVPMVIVNQSPAEIVRKDDGTSTPRKASIVTTFRLVAQAPGYQGDQIDVDGSTLTVTEVLPFSRFGSGFCEAIGTYLGSSPAAIT